MTQVWDRWRRGGAVARGVVTLVCVTGLSACATSAPTEFGALLLRTVIALAAISALAVVTLRLWARGLGGGQAGPASMQVLERLPLGPRHAFLALRAGDRVWIVAQTPHGMQTIGELGLADFEKEERPLEQCAFADVLAREEGAAESRSGERDEWVA